MIKPERSKRSLRFFNSCWRFLTHLKSKNKNKPEPEAEVENVCGSKENIHGGQGEPNQQEVAELPACDESFVTCDDAFVNKEELIIADEGDTVYKQPSPERVIEVQKDYVLPAETLKKTESSSSDDQFFYQPVSKRREVIEKRILSLKGDVTNVERILKNAEDEIKNRHNDLAKWEEKDRQLIAPHPSVDCLPNFCKDESGNVKETQTETTTVVVEADDNDNKIKDNSVYENTSTSKQDIGEVCQVVGSVEVNSNNGKLDDVETPAQPSVSPKNAGGTDLKSLESTKFEDLHGPIAEPRKCISESLVNNVDKENDSNQNIPAVIENALENTEYMDEELQESGLEINQYENNLDDSSDGAQSQTYFSGEVCTTPVTEKSYDDQSMGVQPLGRFAGLGDQNFEQMINNSFTIFSVLEERMCEHGSEIVTSDENVDILPSQSDLNANSTWDGDLTPSVPMFQYADENEGSNELIKNNTPEPLERYFEFNSSHTSLQQELITESEELEKCEKPTEALDDNSCFQDVHELNVGDSAEVTQVNEALNICGVTVKETVEELIGTPTFYLEVDSPSVQMMTEHDYKYPPFQTSTCLSSENKQVEETEEHPERTFDVEYDVQFQEQNGFIVSNEVEYNTVTETLGVYRITEKESADENIETPIFQLEYDVPPEELVTNDYLKPNEDYFEYDPFMNTPSFKPEIILETDQIGQCEIQAEQSLLNLNFNSQYQEQANFSMPKEREYTETLDPYKVTAGESSEENMETPLFHLDFDSIGPKPIEHYFDYDPYHTSDNFKQEIIVESDPIDYEMDVEDNTQFPEQNNFNIPTDIEDSSSKENIDVFEINDSKSFEQNLGTHFYHMEYEPTELPKDPVEEYFDYDPYGTSTFKSEIIVKNNTINYVCENTQFEENLNIANSLGNSVNDNLNAYKVADEESFEKNVANLVHEQVVDRENFVQTDSLQSPEQYYQYNPFQSSVNFSPEILVECVHNENRPERTLDLGHNTNIQEHFDYIEPSNAENLGFYSTGIDETKEMQKFNYEPATMESDGHRTDLVTSDTQESLEQYSEYDPFRSSINLGPEIFVESYQNGRCQNSTEKDTQFQHSELNVSNDTKNPVNVESSDIWHEIKQNPIDENQDNNYEECLFDMEEGGNDHTNENYCHMEHGYEYDARCIEQDVTKTTETDNLSKLNSENVSPSETEEIPTFINEECKECFLQKKSEANLESPSENLKYNDWPKSESDFSWDFGSQDKAVDGDQLKETDHENVTEEIDSNVVPDEIIKEEPPIAAVPELDTSVTNVSDEDESQKPYQAENLEIETHLELAANCEAPNEVNTTEEPPQNDEAQRTRKKRNRKKKGKRPDEEDKSKSEDAPPVEEKVEKEIVEQKDELKETSETLVQEVNRTEEQVVTTNKRNRRKKKQNNQEEPSQVETTLVEETTQEIKNTPPPEPTPEQEISQGTEQEAKKRRNRRKRR